MDQETGEIYISHKDFETGEENAPTNILNTETGENEHNQAKKTFRINTYVIQNGPIKFQLKRYPKKSKKGLKRKINSSTETFRINSTKEAINCTFRKHLKGTRRTPGIKKTQASNFIIAVVFLIPTMIIFTPLLGMIALTSATLLHRYGHYQNKKLMRKGESSIYYQDPLFLVWKEFCPLCKDREMYFKLQTQNCKPNRLNIMQASLRRVVL